MFFAVVFGYLLATVMAFAGVFNVLQFVSEVNREDGYTVFLSGLAGTCTYLVVAVGIVLLIQIASFAERLASGTGRSDFVNIPSFATEHAMAKEVPLVKPVTGEKKKAKKEEKEEELRDESYSEHSDKKPMCVVPPDAPRVPELPIGENPVSKSLEEKQESEELHYFKMPTPPPLPHEGRSRS